MGEGVVDVDSTWLTMMPTNRQLHHLALSFFSLHVRNCSSLGKRLLTLQEEEFPPQYEEKYSQPRHPSCATSVIRPCILRHIRPSFITRAKRESLTRRFSVSPQSRSPISVSLQPRPLEYAKIRTVLQKSPFKYSQFYKECMAHYSFFATQHFLGFRWLIFTSILLFNKLKIAQIV